MIDTKRIETKIEVLARIAFLRGKIEGIRDYAIWKNGEQLVGCLQRPLPEVLAPYIREIDLLDEAMEAAKSKEGE